MREHFSDLKRAFCPPDDQRNIIKDIDAELAFHFECTVEELRRSGMSRTEALEEASRRFGNLLEHRRRLARTRSRIERRKRRREMLGALLQTLQESWRRALRRPALTAAIALIFTLGIGANSIMFDVFERLLQPSSHVASARELRVLSLQGPSPVSVDDWGLAALNRLDSVRGAANVSRVSITLGERESAFVTEAALVSRSFFLVLQVKPYLGRLLRPSDDDPSAPRRAVISYPLWRRCFPDGGSPLHANVQVAGRAYRIIGVAPQRDSPDWSGTLPPSGFPPPRARPTWREQSRP
ncbi:MAG TPA: ABC transporter permease [Acidobacteriota bacterium]|nr:ABC transporter permease [Acidobacteriota bacterium]